MSELEEKLALLESALARFNEMFEYSLEDWPPTLDATIHRFEFSFELTWKTMQLVLKTLEGFNPNSPREVIRRAYAMGWIEKEEEWMQMLVDRNLSTHTYHAELAIELFTRLKDHYAELARVFHLLAQHK
jgi:nucleotidyltransferase substrate binding protein (TIGR01987 family)